MTADPSPEMPRRVPINITPLRQRVLASLDQRGEWIGQDLGYEFATCRRPSLANDPHHGGPFRTPQQATRWSAAFMKPMVCAGLVERWGCGRGGVYRITEAGRRQIRKAHPAGADVAGGANVG